MDSLSKYNKYKEDKRLAKLIAKSEKDIEKHRISLEQKRLERIQSAKDRATTITEKKLLKYVRKKDRWLNEKIRKELGRKPLKQKMPSVAKIKNKAHSAVQKYAKLSKMDKDGYVTLMDTGERVKRNDPKVNAGHLYGKKNYPHLAFCLDNIRPISRWTNKKQWDMYWYEWADNVEAKIGAEKFYIMQKIADDKIHKFIIYDHAYYQKQYEYYNGLCLEILHKLDDK